MGFRPIGNLVTDARCQHKHPAISNLRLQFTIEAQEDVAFLAPVIGAIIRRVFDHPYADRAKLLRAPDGRASLTLMGRGLDLRPISESEWNVSNSHSVDPETFGGI